MSNILDILKGYQMKTCGGCTRELPLSAYNRDKGRHDGLQPRCRECDLAKKRAYREANREKIRAQAQALYTANPEKIRAQKRDRYAANREQIAARVSAYNKANRDRIREYERAAYQANPERRRRNVREWQAANPAYVRSNQAARRMREQSAERLHITNREWQRITSQPCALCGTAEGIEVDHIIPLARGGRHSIGNLQALCRTHNRSKGAKLWSEYRYLVAA